jgi:cysteine-rich repeat protein
MTVKVAAPRATAQCAGQDGMVWGNEPKNQHIDGACASGVCLPIGCGNGKLTPNEVCDDGNTINGDGCAADCQSNETCGNSVIDPAKAEQCDDGNNIDGDGCQQDCRLPRCGDGIKDDTLSEQCDAGDANSTAPDAACRLNCRRAAATAG